uniref:MD-2-related lipid-recognition domain-containing protein n=1 Tax=Anopheles quadriannulatus TaxID=34691 RepID=A0A1I8JW71_ANOQN
MKCYPQLWLSFIFALWAFHCCFATEIFDFEELKNETRPFQLQVMRLVCLDLPYEETVLTLCRAFLRRNQPTLLRVTLEVPGLYNYVLLQFRLHYKFRTYQPFLIDGEIDICTFVKESKLDPVPSYIYSVMQEVAPDLSAPCPLGNKTFNVTTMFKVEYAPKSVPAGDYRMDIRVASRANVTLINFQVYVAVRRKGVLGSMLDW